MIKNNSVIKLKYLVLFVFTFFVLTFFYYYLSSKILMNSDYASILLEAKDIVEGNILLRNWSLSTVSFYTTEIPFYVVAILVLGYSNQIIYLVPAAIYALINILIVCFLWDGKKSLIRIFIALSTITVPGYFFSQFLLVGPIHMGALLYLVLLLLILKKMYSTEKMSNYVCYFLLLFLLFSGDKFFGYLVVPSIIFTAVIRKLSKKEITQEIYICVLTILAYIAADRYIYIIEKIGGFKIIGTSEPYFVTLEKLPQNISLTLKGLLEIYEANIFGKPILTLNTIIYAFHLVCVLIILGVFIYTAYNFFKKSYVIQLLWSIMFFNICEYVFSNMAIDIMSTRYLTTFVIFGSILCGIELPGIFKGKIKDYIIYITCSAYILTFIIPINRTFKKPVNGQELVVDFLESRNLKNGYGEFWNSNIITFDTSDKIKIRAVLLVNESEITPYNWLSKSDWYEDYADFIVFNSKMDGWDSLDYTKGIFIHEHEKYILGDYIVVIFKEDITPYLTKV